MAPHCPDARLVAARWLYASKRPPLFWVYAYEHPDYKGSYNFDTATTLAGAKKIAEDFKAEALWKSCQILGGDDSGPSGDYDSFGGWTR